jgi:hypothetical protein
VILLILMIVSVFPCHLDYTDTHCERIWTWLCRWRATTCRGRSYSIEVPFWIRLGGVCLWTFSHCTTAGIATKSWLSWVRRRSLSASSVIPLTSSNRFIITWAWGPPTKRYGQFALTYFIIYQPFVCCYFFILIFLKFILGPERIRPQLAQ